MNENYFFANSKNKEIRRNQRRVTDDVSDDVSEFAELCAAALG